MKNKLNLDQLKEELTNLDYYQYYELLVFIIEKMRLISDDTINKRSILELEGLGAELWNSVDVNEYISSERNNIYK
jgi:hypothetical protein